MPTNEDLMIMQALPLDIKVAKTKQRIKEFYRELGGQVYVSFSGGKDSTVLLHIVRQVYPDVVGVFCNTGTEFPELVKFVHQMDNITILKPEKKFKEIIQQYGYPLVSKEVSGKIYTARNTPDGAVAKLFDRAKRNDYQNVSYWKFLLDSNIPVHNICCDILKKNPFHKFDRESGLYPIVGTMADESKLRRTQYLQYGCNVFEGESIKSKPLSFWTQQDILQYIYENNIPICSLYGDVVFEDGEYKTTGMNRTGCYCCGYGIGTYGSEKSLDELYDYNPKMYNWVMGGGEFDENGWWRPNQYGLGMGYATYFVINRGNTKDQSKSQFPEDGHFEIVLDRK